MTPSSTAFQVVMTVREININDYHPVKEGCDFKFSCEEPSRRYILRYIGLNNKRHNIRLFKLDGGVLPENTELLRCDYLLLNDTDRRAYYIEFKGSDIKWAIRQIENSIHLFHGGIQRYTIFPRIVYRTGTLALNDDKVLRWKKKYRAKIEKDKIEEPIS